MRIILSMGQVLRQIILLIIYSILHIWLKILNLICVAVAFGFSISWFWSINEKQFNFRLNLINYWVTLFIYRIIYGASI